MYERSEREPDEADETIEECLDNLEASLRRERRKYSKKYIWPNLTPMQNGFIKRFGKNEIYKIISADKNCGLAVIETEHLTERGVKDHLRNADVYKRLSQGEARSQLMGVERLIESFISQHGKVLSKAEATYLKRGLRKNRGKMARFYTTIKMHKDPYKFRPIVSTCGTALAILSKWLDYKLQQLKPFISTFIKDSDDFLTRLKLFLKLKKFGRLPKHARLFTADAISMYTNIDTKHALEVLRKFLVELEEEGNLPPDFDIDMIIQAATLIMQWNLFEYGDCFFKQLIGTAMGTPVAVIWAMIYFHWHEKHKLIPSYGTKIPFMVRFVDDIFGVALVGEEDGFSTDEWNKFQTDIDDFGILRWEVNEPSFSVNFLDLTITIEEGAIVSRTYQKPINLFQYISPNSAHPPWMIKGIISSMLNRYYYQNTYVEDYWTVSMQFYNHLKDRGWDGAIIEPHFVVAHERIRSHPRKKREQVDEKYPSNKDIAILHMEYHPDDIPRKRVRDLWNENCALLERSVDEGGLGIEHMICAYSRPRNLRDLLQKAKLYQLESKEVSTYF